MKQKAKKVLAWGTRKGAIANVQILQPPSQPTTVFCGSWMDSSLVFFGTTVHTFQESVLRKRTRPRDTEDKVQNQRWAQLFQGKFSKSFPIPKVIDDYNHFMNGVDRNDQLRAYYSIDLRNHRTWMPLFYWVLNAIVVNSYTAYSKITKQRDSAS